MENFSLQFRPSNCKKFVTHCHTIELISLPFLYAKEKTSLSSFQKFAGDGIKFTDGRAVEIIDLRITYEKGAPIAYVRPLTIHGRRWLWNHVKYPYAGSNAIVDAEQLLELLQRMDADELTIDWQS